MAFKRAGTISLSNEAAVTCGAHRECPLPSVASVAVDKIGPATARVRFDATWAGLSSLD